MDVASLIDHVVLNGPLLAQAAARAEWDAPVHGTEWDVRTLVTHVGGVHRWATDLVRTGGTNPDTEAGRSVGSGPDDDDQLLEWFLAGHADLVEALEAAPADLTAFTFLPADSPLHFWARRQAHETAVHRADAQAAAGEVTPFEAEFAQDGISEMLTGFARRRSFAIPRAATIGLDAADGPSWLITLGGERIDAEWNDDLTGTDVTVRGLSSDLYLWLWNRRSDAWADGDEDVCGLWRDTVTVRWS